MQRRSGRPAIGALIAGASLLAAACSAGGGSNDTVLAERLLRLGESSETKLEVRSAELPPDLKTLLNPGLAKDAPASEVTSIPVFPGATLKGSFRLERPDGTIAFFLLYDADAKPEDVEPAVAKLVNESPWQTVGGQSTNDVAALRFQNTTTGDLSGTVAIQPVPAAAGTKALTSIVYIVEVEPSTPPANEPYKLPSARPVPDGFPRAFVLNGMTPVSIQWASAPQGKQYQLRFLTKQSSLEVTETYRDVFKREGWTMSADDARGFATQLEFEKDGGISQASLAIDAFAEDSTYTEVAFQLRLSR